MKKIAGIAIALLLLTAFLIASCGSSAVNDNKGKELLTEDSGLITVGFSQLGAESDWRSANTVSMQAAFTPEEGYNLIYKNGQQKQANQITAIRTFIQQEVDYIVLAPVTESGWDSVLEEAKEAGIPVIIVDRRVDVVDKSLYSCWVGSDFELEGKKMAAWIDSYTTSIGMDPSDVHIALDSIVTGISYPVNGISPSFLIVRRFVPLGTQILISPGIVSSFIMPILGSMMKFASLTKNRITAHASPVLSLTAFVLPIRLVTFRSNLVTSISWAFIPFAATISNSTIIIFFIVFYLIIIFFPLTIYTPFFNGCSTLRPCRS